MVKNEVIVNQIDSQLQCDPIFMNLSRRAILFIKVNFHKSKKVYLHTNFKVFHLKIRVFKILIESSNYYLYYIDDHYLLTALI